MTLLASCELVDDSRTGAAIGVKEPVHLQNVSGGATVDGVEVDPTPFFSSFNALQCDHPASLDPLNVGIGVIYHPKRVLYQSINESTTKKKRNLFVKYQ